MSPKFILTSRKSRVVHNFDSVEAVWTFMRGRRAGDWVIYQLVDSIENLPASSDLGRNKAASNPVISNPYEVAYFMLLHQLTPACRAKVLAFKGSDAIPDRATVRFFKDVIALAEQDDLA